MIVVGERINSTRKSIREAIASRNGALILKEAANQLGAGADYIDVNCAMTAGDEVQDIDWVISILQSEIKDISICIDSPNYLAIDRALNTFKGVGKVLINSITGEESRINRIVPLAMKHNAKLIALTIDDKGMPDSAVRRFEIARYIYEYLRKTGFKPENLYFDALIRPISTEPDQGREFLKSLPLIKGLPGASTICGLSNISFGLPNRSLINSTFLVMAIHAGLDSSILDPTDKNVRSVLKASMTILGQDEYCAGYIKAYREGMLV